MTMAKHHPYPFGYPKILREEPTVLLDTRQLYEFHVRKAEHAKQRCDDIIGYHTDVARWEVSTGSTTLPYSADILSERYVANDLIFSKWSGKYRFHEGRAQYLGQRVIMAQNDRLIRFLIGRNEPIL
jgi:hypothetical protein